MVLEKHIETFLTRKVKEKGGVAYKFTSPSRRSVPDRLVLLPGGRIIFVECKAPGKKTTPLQDQEHKKIRALGFEVVVVDSKEGVLDAIS